MEDVLRGLGAARWHLLDCEEYPRASADPFRLEHDIIRWAIRHEESQSVLELEFHAFGDYGERTNSLADILYCTELRSGVRLYFDKRQDPKWLENVKKFADMLTRAVQN